MTCPGEALAKAAEALLGTRFRLGGRAASTGLDCIGLVVVSLEAIGRNVGPLPRYTMRQTEISRFLALASKVGLRPCTGDNRAGDILVLRSSLAQRHLAICSDRATIIHAHAGLRRVTQSSRPPNWPIEHCWRLG